MEHLKDQNALSQADEGAVELPDKELEAAAGAIFSQPATFGHDYQSMP